MRSLVNKTYFLPLKVSKTFHHIKQEVQLHVRRIPKRLNNQGDTQT